MSQIYIIIAIVTLAVIAGLLIFTKRIRPESKLSPLAGLAVASMVAGIVFGENRQVGYSLMGLGVLIALVDSVRKFKK